MRSGIYLGPPVERARNVVWGIVALVVLATAWHVADFLRARNRLSQLRADVERQQAALADIALTDQTEEELAALARLRAASESGVTTVVAPTELLQLLAETLPNDAALVAITIEPSEPNASLLLEAVVQRESDVTTLQRRIAASERVRATQLLEERAVRDGTLSVRLHVDLSEGDIR